MYSSRYLVAIAVAAVVSGCAERPAEHSGSDLYAAHCAACHGAYGEGDGPAIGSISQTVPDLRQIALRNGGAFPREAVTRLVDGREIVAAHSDDVMPTWGLELRAGEGLVDGSDQQVAGKIDALVDFIASIQLQD